MSSNSFFSVNANHSSHQLQLTYPKQRHSKPKPKKKKYQISKLNKYQHRINNTTEFKVGDIVIVHKKHDDSYHPGKIIDINKQYKKSIKIQLFGKSPTGVILYRCINPKEEFIDLLETNYKIQLFRLYDYNRYELPKWLEYYFDQAKMALYKQMTCEDEETRSNVVNKYLIKSFVRDKKHMKKRKIKKKKRVKENDKIEDINKYVTYTVNVGFHKNVKGKEKRIIKEIEQQIELYEKLSKKQYKLPKLVKSAFLLYCLDTFKSDKCKMNGFYKDCYEYKNIWNGLDYELKRVYLTDCFHRFEKYKMKYKKYCDSNNEFFKSSKEFEAFSYENVPWEYAKQIIESKNVMCNERKQLKKLLLYSKHYIIQFRGNNSCNSNSKIVFNKQLHKNLKNEKIKWLNTFNKSKKNGTKSTKKESDMKSAKKKLKPRKQVQIPKPLVNYKKMKLLKKQKSKINNKMNNKMKIPIIKPRKKINNQIGEDSTITVLTDNTSIKKKVNVRKWKYLDIYTETEMYFKMFNENIIDDINYYSQNSKTFNLLENQLLFNLSNKKRMYYIDSNTLNYYLMIKHKFKRGDIVKLQNENDKNSLYLLSEVRNNGKCVLKDRRLNDIKSYLENLLLILPTDTDRILFNSKEERAISNAMEELSDKQLELWQNLL